MDEIRIEKFVFGGQGLGYYGGKPIFTWNALPCELVSIVPIKTKRNFIEAIATKICEQSTYRIAPSEPHFLSCSPWQILDFQEENRSKGLIAGEQFERLARQNLLRLDVVSDNRAFHYRNKMEYGFWEDENDGLELAFFDRGTKRKNKIEPCALAEEVINKAAEALLTAFRKASLTCNDLKSVVLRCARNSCVSASIFVKQREIKEQFSSGKISIEIQALSGFAVYYSSSEIPSPTTDELLFKQGNIVLTENVRGKAVSYSALNFFQVNVPIFERSLIALEPYVISEEIVDYYSGVGSIAIALGDIVKSAVLVESDQESAEMAARNITVNHLDSFRVVSNSAERALNEIRGHSVIIVNPPRAGLNKNLIRQLLAVLPKRIIYLSCNIATQARDIALLSPSYRLTFNELYNFFPRTPHIESLCVLER